MRRLKILTWHEHGSYLYYLGHVPHDIYVPVKEGRPESYGGLPPGRVWPENLKEVPAAAVKDMEFDCVLFQSRKNYLKDRHEILRTEQLNRPSLYLEHDPPREVPTDTRHIVDDPNVLLVHCTHFNDLMWDSNRSPHIVIDHGVTVPPGVRYDGHLDRGIVVVNCLPRRGRRLGLDVFERARADVALDLVGMMSEELGGLGEVSHDRLPAFLVHYRYFFNPIRYTSLGLSILEAMMLGIPIVGLATTELVTVVENGVSGFVDTNIEVLVERMQELSRDRALATALGEGARKSARERFNIERFARDWDNAFRMVSGADRANGRRCGRPGPAEMRP